MMKTEKCRKNRNREKSSQSNSHNTNNTNIRINDANGNDENIKKYIYNVGNIKQTVL